MNTQPSFLPDNYQLPSTSDSYLRIEKGKTTIRICSAAYTGYRDWTEERRPIITRNRPESSINPDSPARHIWMLTVYNYGEKRVQLWVVSQATIQRELYNLATDTGWGDLRDYDISITREGEGMQTKYSVLPMRPAPLSPDVRAALESTPCDPEALYYGGDPFDWRGVDSVDPNPPQTLQTAPNPDPF